MDIWDFVKDISQHKKNLFCDDSESLYNCFVINRAFGNFIDTCLIAQELNSLSVSDKKLHHDFLFNSIKSKSRFSKWAKKEESSAKVQIIIEFYNINKNRAEEIESLISENDLNQMKKQLYKGEFSNAKKSS
jgi:hypothetical protein